LLLLIRAVVEKWLLLVELMCFGFVASGCGGVVDVKAVRGDRLGMMGSRLLLLGYDIEEAFLDVVGTGGCHGRRFATRVEVQVVDRCMVLGRRWDVQFVFRGD
jgi:hypothetical protein